MADEQQISCSALRLDMKNETVWRGQEMIPLRRKTFSLLKYLVERSGRLVDKKKLIEDLWADSHVCDDVLKQSIVEIRRALNDDANAPLFIETVHRKGYRFIGKIDNQGSISKKPENEISVDSSRLTGRESDLALLEAYLKQALGGERQVVFVSGEQGIGKTALMDSFLEMIGRDMSRPYLPDFELDNSELRLLVARGQCLKSHGMSEAYMPIFEAFTRLCREPAGSEVMAVLNRHAPLWLKQMPSLVSTAKFEILKRMTVGATRQRMLREMADSIEALGVHFVLVLVIEDLHWSDYHTLDLISYLAQRRAAARLLLALTFRPEEAASHCQRLLGIKHELAIHRQCRELLMDPLEEEAVREYLAKQFPNHDFPEGLAPWIQSRTEGNPLFMVNMVDQLVELELITYQGGRHILSKSLESVKPGVPATIQQMIMRQIEQCSDRERQVLEAGSVAGMNFNAMAVAAALDKEVEQVEDLCKSLVQRHNLLKSEDSRPLPDGKLTSCYSFKHILYQETCYDALRESRRAQLHRRIRGII
jgi:predicted ATPase